MMCRTSFLAEAVLVFVLSAQAAAWSKDKWVEAFGSKTGFSKAYPAWLQGVSTEGDGYCNVAADYGCVVGVGEGICYILVNPGDYAVPLSSTDSGYKVQFSGSARFGLELRKKDRGTAQNLKSDQNITVTTSSPSSHWNLCWKKDGDYPFSAWARDGKPQPELGSESRGFRGTSVEDYCYFVNGLCFLWVSPCSGGCASLGALTGPLANPLYATFCPAGLRYASADEWADAEPTLIANKSAFHAKCAAEVIDPTYDHCDEINKLVRVPNGGYDEQVLVCGDAQTFSSPTPSPPPPAPAPSPPPSPPPPAGSSGGVHATGDPHLQNVHGQRFDLMKPGTHTLINIPKGELHNQLLRVQAKALRLGGCKDMYFQELNITGSWAEAEKAGGYRHAVAQRVVETPQWVAFGTVELKVVHGYTNKRLEYLNFYVKHLGRAGFTVGGLLGDDDHTAESTPSGSCARRGVALLESDPDSQYSSVAMATFA
ncbi:unnamed protein product [Prorocentrum cordatum]|uniref:Uncharacterized protein n=1 Tax=Prorocentrum cordatum TaxID=2364126 RepID=A0ABN9VB05_9DINO|nr:unnamed protein product [Polarella glacialis]